MFLTLLTALTTITTKIYYFLFIKNKNGGFFLMKLKCNRQDLVEAVNIVEKAVPVKSTMDIMEGIFLETKENSFHLVGNNMELGLECEIDADVLERGMVVVKASLFSNAVKKLPDFEDEVFIEVDEKDNIKIACGNAKFDFATASGEDFPLLPVVEDDNSFTIKESCLKSMVRQTLYAISTKEDKPVLTGICFDVEDKTIHVVGCDGYRVAIRKEAIETEKSFKFILPGKNAKELLSIIGDSEDEIKISLSSNNVKINLKKCTFVSRIIEGEYLNYKSVADHKNNLMIEVETRKIFNSIDRAAMIVSEAAKSYVLLNIEDDNVFINCESAMGKVNDKFSVNMIGEAMQIAFNPRYLIDAFKNIDDEVVKFSFSTPVTPTVIKPIEGDAFTYIVLPVRIK